MSQELDMTGNLKKNEAGPLAGILHKTEAWKGAGFRLAICTSLLMLHNLRTTLVGLRVQLKSQTLVHHVLGPEFHPQHYQKP